MNLRLLVILCAALLLGACSPNPRRSGLTIPPQPAAKSKMAKDSLQPIMRRQVLNAIDAGDGDPEVRRMREKVASEPGNLAVRLELASHYEKAGFPEVALEHLRLAAQRFPDSEEALVALVKGLRGMANSREAIGAVQAYLRVHPSATPAIHSWLGILADEAGNLKAGEASHRAAVAGDPRSDSLRNNLGYNLLLQGRKEEAAAEFRRALGLNARSQVARNNLGLALADQPDEALREWRSAGDLAAAHNNLAALYIEEGRIKDARRELETALSYRKDLPQVISNLRLVSELDGAPVVIPAKANASFWKRLAHGFKWGFVDSGPREAKGELAVAAK